jgi:hypothetical protein
VPSKKISERFRRRWQNPEYRRRATAHLHHIARGLPCPCKQLGTLRGFDPPTEPIPSLPNPWLFNE